MDVKRKLNIVIEEEGEFWYDIFFYFEGFSHTFQFKKCIQCLECSWNHEYFGSLAE